MGEALVEVLRTIVQAPFQGLNLFDLRRQGPEGILHFFDIGGCAAIFEFKEYYVAQYLVRMLPILGLYSSRHGQ